MHPVRARVNGPRVFRLLEAAAGAAGAASGVAGAMFRESPPCSLRRRSSEAEPFPTVGATEFVHGPLLRILYPEHVTCVEGVTTGHSSTVNVNAGPFRTGCSFGAREGEHCIV
jgi:hypothetical protein